MPLIKNFKANSIRNAFILNSMVASITIIVALVFKHEYDQITKKQDEKTNINIAQITFLLLITFVTSMITYTLFYLIFGFGGGMLITEKKLS